MKESLKFWLMFSQLVDWKYSYIGQRLRAEPDKEANLANAVADAVQVQQGGDQEEDDD